MDPWLIVCAVLSFCMSFSIGSNDASNGLATSYGCRALSLPKLLAIGALAEFMGAMFCSDKVAQTLSKEIINNFDGIDFDVKERMMFSIILTSFVFILCSTCFGMPISGTHTVIGAYMGAGFAVSN